MKRNHSEGPVGMAWWRPRSSCARRRGVLGSERERQRASSSEEALRSELADRLEVEVPQELLRRLDVALVQDGPVEVVLVEEEHAVLDEAPGSVGDGGAPGAPVRATDEIAPDRGEVGGARAAAEPELRGDDAVEDESEVLLPGREQAFQLHLDAGGDLVTQGGEALPADPPALERRQVQRLAEAEIAALGPR